MTRIAWGHSDQQLNEVLAGWCAAHIGMRGFDGPYTTMGVFRDEQIVAVVVYNNYHREEGVIELHAAAIDKRWLTRPVLWAMFEFAFITLECQMVVLRVAEENTALLRILTAYGFDHVVIPRLRGRDKGERILWLTDDAWIGNGFHKEIR